MFETFSICRMVVSSIDASTLIGAATATTATAATTLALWIGLIYVIFCQTLCIQALLQIGLIVSQRICSRCWTWRLRTTLG
jgi:hypothetical protein